jgi:hypothetical protein
MAFPRRAGVNPSYALGRLPTGKMNKGETEYATILEQEKHDGLILWWKFEGVKLRLADNTFITIDFPVMRADGLLEMREFKGFWTEDARAKTKIAASMYPFRFIAVKKIAKGRYETEAFE